MKLNKITKKDSYTIPRISDNLDVMCNAKFFSTMDLNAGFYNIKVKEEDRPKTAFTTGSGLYHWIRMPMGLCNSPSTFQRAMDHVLNDLRWQDCLLYLDDLMVFSKDFDEHLERLGKVFEKLRSSNIRLKPSKCKFLQKEVEFLGHVVNEEGLRPNPKKLEAIRFFKTPKTVKHVQSFLGICNYYRKYIKGIAGIAKPLYNLLQKGIKWKWGEKEKEAFETLKERLVTAPVLAFYDPEKDIIIKTDASQYAVGAILAQKEGNDEKVVQYFSKVLNRYQRSYSTVEQEALAIIFAFKEFRPYIDGKKFIVYTDNSALTNLPTMNSGNKRLERWALYLQQFDYTIVHKKGTLNSDVDCLSRYPKFEETLNNECARILDEKYEKLDFETRLRLELGDEEKEGLTRFTYFCFVNREEMSENDFISEKKKDKFCKMICAKLKYGIPTKNFVLIEGILYKLLPTEDNFNPSLVIPKGLQKQIIKTYHDGGLGSHMGIFKTLKKIQERFYWPSMRQDITSYIGTCRTCQEIKISRLGKEGLMGEMRSKEPWERVHIDFQGPWVTSGEGNKYIIVAQDSFSKWIEIKAVEKIDAVTTANFLLNRFILKWGAPKELVSDNGKQFLSEVVK